MPETASFIIQVSPRLSTLFSYSFFIILRGIYTSLQVNLCIEYILQLVSKLQRYFDPPAQYFNKI